MSLDNLFGYRLNWVVFKSYDLCDGKHPLSIIRILLEKKNIQVIDIKIGDDNTFMSFITPLRNPVRNDQSFIAGESHRDIVEYWNSEILQRINLPLCGIYSNAITPSSSLRQTLAQANTNQSILKVKFFNRGEEFPGTILTPIVEDYEIEICENIEERINFLNIKRRMEAEYLLRRQIEIEQSHEYMRIAHSYKSPGLFTEI